MAKKIAKEYYLMHKDIPVCLMELTEGGTLGNYRKNEAALAHFPIGGQMNDMNFMIGGRTELFLRRGTELRLPCKDLDILQQTVLW
jgi:hypothetical protein